MSGVDENASTRAHPTVPESLREYGRGFAGGLLFSLPLLYTMEVWWAGFIAAPERLIGYIAVVFVLLLGYNRYSGLHPDASLLEVLLDSVEELGLGILTATLVLYLIGRIGVGESLEEAFGKIVVEAGAVAIGFSVGTAQLGAGENESGSRRKREDGPGVGDHVALSACGAALFAANVGPTEEVLKVAVEATSIRLIGIALVSVLLTAMILYFSDFAGAKQLLRVRAPRDVLAGTMLTYGVALAVAALILWFFGRFEGAWLGVAIEQIVVLGFPSALGASAGRLLLQQ